MQNLCLQRRATLPFEVPLLVVSKVLRSIQEFPQLYSRLRQNIELSRVPLLSSQNEIEALQFDIRIVNCPCNGSKPSALVIYPESKPVMDQDYFSHLYDSFYGLTSNS